MYSSSAHELSDQLLSCTALSFKWQYNWVCDSKLIVIFLWNSKLFHLFWLFISCMTLGVFKIYSRNSLIFFFTHLELRAVNLGVVLTWLGALVNMKPYRSMASILLFSFLFNFLNFNSWNYLYIFFKSSILVWFYLAFSFLSFPHIWFRSWPQFINSSFGDFKLYF